MPGKEKDSQQVEIDVGRRKSSMKQDPLPGQHVGAYSIEEKLGQGGMASVYKARHARLQREVAIKVIAPHFANDADFRARFEREAQLIARLEHRNIVAVYDFGEDNGLMYLAMQYVSGGTLRDQLHEGQPLATRQAVTYTLQMARALHHAHQRGIVHRDIKPHNMLVSGSDTSELLLSDFGLAKLFDESKKQTIGPAFASEAQSDSGNYTFTGTGQVVGTAEYMAPEQIQRQAVDARTDIYALGVVLYQMLTGRVPFEAASVLGLMYHHVSTPPKPVRDLNPAVPRPIALITEKALAKSPEARFQTAEAMAQALEDAAANAIPATPLPPEHAPYRYTPAAPPPPPYTNSPGGSSSNRSQPTTHDMYAFTSRQALDTSAAPATSRQKRAALNAHGANVDTGYAALQGAARLRRPQTVISALLLVLACILIAWRVLPLLGIHTPTGQVTTPARAFVETFADNGRQWTTGGQDGLTATVKSGTYTLLTDASNNTHFPYPANVGTLPASFSLSARFTQDAGSTAAPYGLVFYLTPGDNQVPSCYAFTMSSAGDYALLRYQPGQASPTFLGRNSSTAIHQGLSATNTLQVVVQDGHFHFTINGQPAPLNESNTITDTTYKNGQPGLLVAGVNTRVRVSNFTLTIP